MHARPFFVLLATLLLACGGSGDTGSDTAADSGADTATSGVTPEDCTSDQVYANACTDCGPTDGCTAYEAMCLATCPDGQDGDACPGGGFCVSGTCLPVICG